MDEQDADRGPLLVVVRRAGGEPDAVEQQGGGGEQAERRREPARHRHEAGRIDQEAAAGHGESVRARACGGKRSGRLRRPGVTCGRAVAPGARNSAPAPARRTPPPHRWPTAPSPRSAPPAGMSSASASDSAPRKPPQVRIRLAPAFAVAEVEIGPPMAAPPPAGRRAPKVSRRRLSARCAMLNGSTAVCRPSNRNSRAFQQLVHQGPEALHIAARGLAHRPVKRAVAHHQPRRYRRDRPGGRAAPGRRRSWPPPAPRSWSPQRRSRRWRARRGSPASLRPAPARRRPRPGPGCRAPRVPTPIL